MEKRSRASKKFVNKAHHDMRMLLTRMSPSTREFFRTAGIDIYYYGFGKRWRAIERSHRKILEGKQ